jgi:hypothetical protein
MTNAIYDFMTQTQEFPAGTVAAGYHLTLKEATTGAVLVGTAALGQTEVTVADVPPGTYSASIALVDAAGVPLAPAVVAAFALVVAPPAPTTVSLAVPTTLAAKV